jgi:small ubiquitin-related modifier
MVKQPTLRKEGETLILPLHAYGRRLLWLCHLKADGRGTGGQKKPFRVAPLRNLIPPCPSLYSLLLTQNGEETFFKIKKTTKMSKVFQTYAAKKGVQVGSIRFLLDGERIEPEQTPKMLELEDQDQIDCVLEQTGGVGLW